MSFKGYLKKRIKDIPFLLILLLFSIACITSGIIWIVNGNVRNIIMSFCFILIVPAFFVVEYFIKIKAGVIFTFSICFLAFGSILGSCFNLYTTVPFFDTILHGLSGVIFACLGFSLSRKFFGEENTNKTFFGHLLFAIFFSLAIAVVWELIEYFLTILFGFDMMEDGIVNNIRSYYLSGSHNQVVELNDIAKTIIYYGNGNSIEINGYLDIGLIDTIIDMFVCFVGAIFFFITTILSNRFCPKINKSLIPNSLEL